MSPQQVARVKARLDQLGWYPHPVRIDRVRIVATPWLFRLPWFRRFDGYALHGTILLRAAESPDDLVVHELCHVWQMQHRPVRMPLSYFLSGYWNNPYERQARAAVELTKSDPWLRGEAQPRPSTGVPRTRDPPAP